MSFLYLHTCYMCFKLTSACFPFALSLLLSLYHRTLNKFLVRHLQLQFRDSHGSTLYDWLAFPREILCTVLLKWLSWLFWDQHPCFYCSPFPVFQALLCHSGRKFVFSSHLLKPRRLCLGTNTVRRFIRHQGYCLGGVPSISFYMLFWFLQHQRPS
jgi:hypothetical protein